MQNICFPGRLLEIACAGDHANIQVTQFIKRMPFIIVLTTVWFEGQFGGFHFCAVYFLQFPKQHPAKLPNRKTFF